MVNDLGLFCLRCGDVEPWMSGCGGDGEENS